MLERVFGTGPDQMIPYLADGITRLVAWEVMFTVGMALGAQRPLLVLSPVLAQTLARAGLSKQDVQVFGSGVATAYAMASKLAVEAAPSIALREHSPDG